MVRASLFLLATGLAAFAAGTPELLSQIHNGNHAEVRALLHGGADVNSKDELGTSALMHAVIESDAAMVKLLIEAGAAVNVQNEAGSTALMYASTNLAKTQLLLAAGADVTLKNKTGANPMSVAVTTYGSTPVLKLLVAKGAAPEGRLMTPVAQKGDLEAIQYLLSIGVSAGPDSGALSAALGSGCEACVRLLLDKGAPADGARGANGQGGVLSQSVKRALTDLSQLMFEHGASVDVKDRDGYTLLMQAVISMAPAADRDRMVQWLLSKGADPNTKSDRGETAYLLASRAGATGALELLAKAGATEMKDEWPTPVPASDARTAVVKVLPLLETSGEAVFKNRKCISCHNNSLPAMTVALARQKGLTVNEEQAKKELGFAVATDQPYFEQMRLGSTIGGGADTLGYTLMGMAAAGYAADALTDSHIHYLSIYQYPDGAWRTTSYRPPSEYSPFATTAVVLRAMRLYPLPGRHDEFEERFVRAKKWLLTHSASSGEEHCMQLNALAAAGATAEERAPFVKALKALQHADGSWSQVPESHSEAYATGEALYALHVSGDVPTNDPVYQKGVQWLLRNQLADGSWFVPTRTTPGQPHFESGFPHGPSQFSSDGGSSWATMALLFTLPDRPAAKPSAPAARKEPEIEGPHLAARNVGNFGR
jgi:ankyrin repeat protein